MKKIFFLLLVACSIGSCKKEYTCDNGQVYRKGSIQYEQLKRGETITDYNGQELHCY